MKSYSELCSLSTFEERYEYLKMSGSVGQETFGADRYLNQYFYKSKEWKRIRDEIILRDHGCDLALEDYPISGRAIIHHINPLTLSDIESCSSALTDSENLICVSHLTHNAIHYGDSELIPKPLIKRKPNDTVPWK